MHSLRATFHNGVFRPVEPVNLPDGTFARVEIDEASDEKPWMRYCGTISQEDTATMTAAIHEAFERVHPDDWK